MRREISGRAVTGGVAVGAALYVGGTSQRHLLRVPIQADDVGRELERLHRAVESTSAEIRRTRERVGKQVGAEIAGIFAAHELILKDALYLGAIERKVEDDLVNAEWAVQQVADALSEKFARIESEHLRERGEDLRDITRYLLRSLQGDDTELRLPKIDDGMIVLTEELTPSDALRLARQGIAGLVLEAGGPNSHTAIVARAIGLPLVVGVGPVLDQIPRGHEVILDADRGVLVLEPTADELRAARQAKEPSAAPDLARRDRTSEAVTRDGETVRLLANIELLDELPLLRIHGAGGIGLYRSEFLYMEHSPDLPSEEAHLETFRRILEAEGLPEGAPVIIRTFDLGGRAIAREVLETEEENPSLGLRGVRLTLRRRDVFRTQLRALFRASVHGNLHIMVPLVSNLEEVLEFRTLCSEVREELLAEGHPVAGSVPLGAMVEVPGAALIADSLARELDFLSLGTNDLVQYALAVDRNNEHVADLYQPLHPAILRMIRGVVQAAERHDRMLSICGEMASRPSWAALLVGLGLRTLSMTPAALPPVRDHLEAIRAADYAALAESALQAGSASEIGALLHDLESAAPVA